MTAAVVGHRSPVALPVCAGSAGGWVCWFDSSGIELDVGTRTRVNLYAATHVRHALAQRVTTLSRSAAAESTRVTAHPNVVTSITWDQNGNMLREQAMDGSLTSYTWDQENRLQQISSPDGTFATNTYSAEGHRQKAVTSAGTSNYVWDFENVLEELDSGLLVVRRYTDFPGFWGGLTSMRQSGASSFYAFDQQWSTRQLF